MTTVKKLKWEPSGQWMSIWQNSMKTREIFNEPLLKSKSIEGNASEWHSGFWKKEEEKKNLLKSFSK